MNIFGLEPYLGAIAIATLGIAVSTIVGWLATAGAKYDPRKVAASVLIGFPASLIVVATELQVLHIPESDGGLTALIVTAGLIAQVAGFDTVAKTGAKAAAAAFKSETNKTD